MKNQGLSILKILFYSITLMFFTIVISCSSDNNDIYIAGKTLVQKKQRMYTYLYRDKPVTRITENSSIISNGKVITDTLTVTHFQYEPDSQFISKRLVKYTYNSFDNLQKEEWIGLDNSSPFALSLNYQYNEQNLLSKILYQNDGLIDSTLITYNMDNSILINEYNPWYVNKYRVRVDANNRVLKREVLEFLGSPDFSVHEFSYNNDNLDKLSFYSSQEPQNKDYLEYHYLNDRPIPELIKKLPQVIFGQTVIIPFLYNIHGEESIPAYAYQNLFVDYIKRSYDNTKFQYDYEFSADGYPLNVKIYMEHPDPDPNINIDKLLQFEIEYIYK